MTYNHLLEIIEEDRILNIYRIYKNGEQELFTQVELPCNTIVNEEANFKKFCCILGENLLLDSPVARKLLDL